jgi:hypothetical protein
MMVLDESRPPDARESSGSGEGRLWCGVGRGRVDGTRRLYRCSPKCRKAVSVKGRVGERPCR